MKPHYHDSLSSCENATTTPHAAHPQKPITRKYLPPLREGGKKSHEKKLTSTNYLKPVIVDTTAAPALYFVGHFSLGLCVAL